MAKTTAAIYAQLRRDNEIGAREALKPLIPEEYFTTEIQDNGEWNMTTKVLVATRNYLKTIKQDAKDEQAEKQADNPVESIEKGLPFAISVNGDSSSEPSEDIRQLRQVVARLVHKVEEKVQAGGDVSETLEKIVDHMNEYIIDMIETVEEIS